MDPDLYQVVLGEHTISIKTGNELRRNISAIFINNKFSYNTFNNDIALLKVGVPRLFLTSVDEIVPYMYLSTDDSIDINKLAQA